MPPKKIINRSRNVGGAKRGRPPKQKTEQPPAPPLAPDWETSSNTSDWVMDGAGQSSIAPTNGTSSNSNGNGNGNGKNGITPSVVASKAQSYTDLSQVGNTLKFPTFDPNQYFSTDLFTDSSPLARTTKEDADAMVQSIEEKRQTVRVATANIQLNQDVVKAGNEYQKLEGLAIDYATTGVNNQTKFVSYQLAGVNKEIAINKFDQANERLTQGERVLNGMRSITPLIDSEWQQRKSLKESQINSLKILAVQAKQALEPAITQLSQEFKQELESA